MQNLLEESRERVFIRKKTFSDSDDDALQDLDITKYKLLDRKRRDLTSITDEKTDEKTVEKRSSSGEEKAVSSLDEVAELLEGSENTEDVNRRTRQLRPSIISSPWRVSSGASYRAIDYSPSYGSNLNNFPSATSGLLFKSDGRFYPNNNNFKSSDEFNPVISTYSGGKNKYQSYNSFSGESGERSQEATPKYKQSSKIPSHSSSLFPLLFSLDSFEPKSKSTTAATPQQDNYSYFHIGKTGSQSQTQPKSEKLKTFAFPVTNLPSSTPRNPFASFGGFFNNNQQTNQFSPIKTIVKPVTPAPIYEGAKSASSYDSRYTTATPIKATPSVPYANNPFLNNLAFGNQSPSLYHFGGDLQKEEKVVQITTKKPTFTQYPIPSSTPKYLQAYTTPNQLFDFDKFVAGIREAQRQQNGQKFAGISNNLGSPLKNKTQNVRFQQVYSTSTTASPDDYYYEDEDVQVDDSLNKFKTQSAKPSINSFNRKPVTNANEDDFYYEDDDYEEEEEIRPPPVNKSKYMPMTETMAPRPMNVTTQRYYVSGHTFSTPSPPPSTSAIPSILKFPDDVFQAIRPFTSPAPNLINKFNVKPNKNHDITKSTTSTTTERTSTKRTKVKIFNKPTTSKSNVRPTASSTTAKPTRLTTRRKTYTIRPNRGDFKFNKDATKRPDLTRLEIDDKLPNR